MPVVNLDCLLSQTIGQFGFFPSGKSIENCGLRAAFQIPDKIFERFTPKNHPN